MGSEGLLNLIHPENLSWTVEGTLKAEKGTFTVFPVGPPRRVENVEAGEVAILPEYRTLERRKLMASSPMKSLGPTTLEGATVGRWEPPFALTS
ncbi:hypothetical protein [Thermococcus sp. 2319x1]|uniref:hypothetical protein n=1 Tax=Thermococcus sp. 2319x1 TaxID=1674923 RepID=UPI0011877367|nr:hypothetical protein [Thermococcus sp. 2319x1]